MRSYFVTITDSFWDNWSLLGTILVAMWLPKVPGPCPGVSHVPSTLLVASRTRRSVRTRSLCSRPGGMRTAVERGSGLHRGQPGEPERHELPGELVDARRRSVEPQRRPRQRPAVDQPRRVL